MSLHKDRAIVLSKRVYAESDKIVKLFTLNSGKVSAIARGGNKSFRRFMNTLEPFNYINVEYFDRHNKGMARIENADIIETNSGMERSLKKVCIASFFTEFADKLTKEREKNENLFHTLHELLKKVKEWQFTHETVLHYQLRMLEVLGFLPNFTNCVQCGEVVPDDRKIFFSVERGGIICTRCSDFLPCRVCAEGVIPWLSSMKEIPIYFEEGLTEKSDAQKVNGVSLLQAREIMEEFVSFHLDVEFKSYRLLKGFIFT